MSESMRWPSAAAATTSRWPMIRGLVLLFAGALLITGQVLKLVATSRLSELRQQEVARTTEETRQVAADVRKAGATAAAERAERNAAAVGALLEQYREEIDLRDRQLRYADWLNWLVALTGVIYGLYEVIRAARAAHRPPEAVPP